MNFCSHLGFGAILCLLMAGCGRPADLVEVTDTAEVSPYRAPVKVNATSEERFRLALPNSQSEMAPAASAPADGTQSQLFHWEMPEGWTELPPTSMRLINLRFGVDGESEAYLTFLSDGGGGVVANVNRWRAQMGLPPITEAEIAALPKKPFFGRDAVFIDIAGTYSGMADPAPKPNYRLMGVLLEHGGQGIFLKMVGPATDMEGQEPNLDLLLSSIHLDDKSHTHDDAPAGASGEAEQPEISPTVPPASTGADGLTWTEPEGWSRESDRPMRLVTYSIGDTECYVTVLGPGGGGLLANLNRWLGQFSKPPIDESGLKALPVVTVLGEPAPLLEAEGDFTGMDGSVAPGQRMLAVARLLPDKSVFIKMTGPSAEVEAQRNAFIAFCESLRAN